MSTVEDDPFAGLADEPQFASNPPRRNEYRGACVDCGGWVEPHQGFLIKNEGAGSRWLVRHESCPGRKTPAKSRRVTEDGIYRHPDGRIYKVQVAVHGSGNLYAKELIFEEGNPKGEFVFAAGMVKRLRPEWKMSLEEAKQFGALYGFCCRCGRTLTDEYSIANGIGPICAGKF